MSQFLPDRHFPQFCDSPPGETGSPMSMPLAQTRQWPQFYAIPPAHPSHPRTPNFATYPAPRPLNTAGQYSYTSSWHQPSISSSTTTNIPQVEGPHSDAARAEIYHPHASVLSALPPVLEYQSSSQRTPLAPSSSQHRPIAHPLYGYKFDRPRSSSSLVSASSYGIDGHECEGMTEWDGVSAGEEDVSKDAPTVVGNDSSSFPSSSTGDVDEYAAESSTESRQTSVPASVSATADSPIMQPHIKMEPDDRDGCFIMEHSSFPSFGNQPPPSKSSHTNIAPNAYADSLLNQRQAPPTEVPLRATQASKEMRRMMGVFRLNPFAMHSLSLGGPGDGESVTPGPMSPPAASWCGGEARPLDEEPVIFEFQLDIPGLECREEAASRRECGISSISADLASVPGLGAKEESQLRPFSPSFEIHQENVDAESSPEGQLDEPRDYEQHPGPLEDAVGSGFSDIESNGVGTQSVQHGEARLPDTHPISQLCGSQHCPQVQTTSPHQTAPAGWDAVHEPIEDVQTSGTADSSSRTNFLYQGAPHRGPRLHTTTSHPYLRKTDQYYPPSANSIQSYTRQYPQSHLQAGMSLLSMPTHHSQQDYIRTDGPEHDTHGYHDRYSQVQNQSSFGHPQSQQTHLRSQPAQNGLPSGPTLGTTPMLARTDDASNFRHPTPSYMRSGQEYRDQIPDNEGYSSPRSASSASNDIHDGTYTPPLDSIAITPVAVGHPTMQVYHIQGGAGLAANNRRWSLAETGVGLGHGPFLNTM